MYCSECSAKMRCVDSRMISNNKIRRRRYKCELCANKQSTYETEQHPNTVNNREIRLANGKEYLILASSSYFNVRVLTGELTISPVAANEIMVR